MNSIHTHDSFYKGNTYRFFQKQPLSKWSCLGLLRSVFPYADDHYHHSFFGEKEVSDEIFSQFNDTFGSKVSKQIQEIVSDREIKQNSTLATGVGFLVLMLSSSAMLRQLHLFFNRIWRIKVKRKREVQNYLFKQFVSFALLIGLVFFVLVSTGLSSFLLEFNDRLSSNYSFTYGYELVVSFFILGTIFTLLFSILSDAIVHWKPAILGGVFLQHFCFR